MIADAVRIERVGELPSSLNAAAAFFALDESNTTQGSLSPISDKPTNKISDSTEQPNAEAGATSTNEAAAPVGGPARQCSRRCARQLRIRELSISTMRRWRHLFQSGASRYCQWRSILTNSDRELAMVAQESVCWLQNMVGSRRGLAQPAVDETWCGLCLPAKPRFAIEARKSCKADRLPCRASAGALRRLRHGIRVNSTRRDEGENLHCQTLECLGVVLNVNPLLDSSDNES